MTEIVSTITSKGQITLPIQVRRHLGVGTNDKIIFVLEQDGTVEVRVPKYPTIESLAGSAGSLGKTVSKQEMLDTAYEDHAQEVARKLK